MEQRVFFEKLVEKIGLPEAYFMFMDKLSSEITDEFTFEEWDDIHSRAGWMSSENNKKRIATARDIAFRKMLDKAESIEELLQVYPLTKDGSQEEKTVLQKLSQFQYPEKWLEILNKKGRLYAHGKALAYFKEKIEKLIDL